MRILWIASALLPFVGPLALAAEGYENPVAARILPGWERPDGTRIIGVELTLAPGWKTYWRAPGDSGIPPRFDWSGSRKFDFYWLIVSMYISIFITI